MQVLKGKKQQMSQIFLDTGEVIPVTIIVCETEPDEELLNKPISVTGKSKGKGFTGVMKRWNFKGGPATRGQSNKPRAPGSIGSQTPGKVFKGKKMAGKHGNKKVTVKGLTVVKVEKANNEVFVSGPVPGARNSKVQIKVMD